MPSRRNDNGVSVACIQLQRTRCRRRGTHKSGHNSHLGNKRITAAERLQLVRTSSIGIGARVTDIASTIASTTPVNTFARKVQIQIDLKRSQSNDVSKKLQKSSSNQKFDRIS
jgi:hypothetical protein